MDQTERTIHKYLRSLHIGVVEYEPDGSVPPDFVVDGRIAVEARRLNEHEEVDGTPRGLEVTANPLREAVVKALSQSGPPHSSRTWYVHYTVSRPLPPWKELQRSLREAIQVFRQRLDTPPAELRIGPALRLEFSEAGFEYERLLVLGSSSDHDSGGFVIAELLRNLRICIEQESRKIAPVRYKYPEWWLAFDDRIAYGTLDQRDVDEVRRVLGDVPGFAKVLLVNPLEPTRGLDLLAARAA